MNMKNNGEKVSLIWFYCSFAHHKIKMLLKFTNANLIS